VVPASETNAQRYVDDGRSSGSKSIRVDVIGVFFDVVQRDATTIVADSSEFDDARFDVIKLCWRDF
jgi:hypothetical protein